MSDTSTGEPPEEGGDEPRSGEPLRPIPDGGLRAAMPDWLRQSPSWRTRDDQPPETPVRSLIVPDTSVIDPRTILDVDDLPPWLQAIAAREGPANDALLDVVTAPVPPVTRLVPETPDPDPVAPPELDSTPPEHEHPRRIEGMASGLDSQLVPALLIVILLIGLALLGIWIVEAV